MVESFLIALREGFEAALIVSIVLAVVRSEGRESRRAVWLGVAAATIVAVVAGIGLRAWAGGLEGIARGRAFAAIAFLAAGMLTWMIFWMRRHVAQLTKDLRTDTAAAVGAGSLVGLAAVTFTAVVREGLETALFLVAAATSAEPVALVSGTVLGLAAAIALAWAIHTTGRRIPMGAFFTITGLLLIAFAAGLAARGVQLLQATGDLGSLDMAVYDLTQFDWLTIQTQVGRFLAGIFGWDPRPSLEQVEVYLLYLVPVGMAYLWPNLRTHLPHQPTSRA